MHAVDVHSRFSSGFRVLLFSTTERHSRDHLFRVWHGLRRARVSALGCTANRLASVPRLQVRRFAR